MRGAGTPNIQPFDVYDPDSLILLETGTTQLKQIMVNPTASAVPTLSHWSKVILILLLLVITGFYFKKTNQEFYTRFK